MDRGGAIGMQVWIGSSQLVIFIKRSSLVGSFNEQIGSGPVKIQIKPIPLTSLVLRSELRFSTQLTTFRSISSGVLFPLPLHTSDFNVSYTANSF